MTFIPNPKYFVKGDKVRLTRDFPVVSGTFTKGHVFEIQSIEASSDPRDYGWKSYHLFCKETGMTISTTDSNIERVI